mmetsp:Transcript_154/g.199  ORF Transcript_154/g.199 Transcript_154/m.199 type:complete len:147 (-) Transcript_154:211-651(-)|eukprot:CAMPEP_0197233246 /NCGR_PEP_ID=MMETSP1429-20130617/1365_1 /TAXON_ID=49237 /ORGANISM="Chaetoceros  sp., Strain UNC1202" /LENGTH=146 /DNA_ID=CAMNT_0042691461 /DNA_START=134 /DNA_END=574 /DNA_ORIENTATION=-
MADHPDFLDYAAHFEETTAQGSHTEWQQTSVLGRITLLLLKLGDNSFIHAIVNSLSDQEGGDSQSARFVSIFANFAIVIMGVLAAYVIGRILQMFIGREIVINQEIIIEEEVKLSDLKKQKKSAEEEKGVKEKKGRRNAREKKKIS